MGGIYYFILYPLSHLTYTNLPTKSLRWRHAVDLLPSFLVLIRSSWDYFIDSKTIRTSSTQFSNPAQEQPIAHLCNLQCYQAIISTHHSTKGKNRDFDLKPHLYVWRGLAYYPGYPAYSWAFYIHTPYYPGYPGGIQGSLSTPDSYFNGVFLLHFHYPGYPR